MKYKYIYIYDVYIYLYIYKCIYIYEVYIYIYMYSCLGSLVWYIYIYIYICVYIYHGSRTRTVQGFRWRESRERSEKWRGLGRIWELGLPGFGMFFYICSTCFWGLLFKCVLAYYSSFAGSLSAWILGHFQICLASFVEHKSSIVFQLILEFVSI